jgi:hypothetical protein
MAAGPAFSFGLMLVQELIIFRRFQVRIQEILANIKHLEIRCVVSLHFHSRPIST